MQMLPCAFRCGYTLCCVVLCGAVWCCVVLCCAVWCCVVFCCVLLCSVVFCCVLFWLRCVLVVLPSSSSPPSLVPPPSLFRSHGCFYAFFFASLLRHLLTTYDYVISVLCVVSNGVWCVVCVSFLLSPLLFIQLWLCYLKDVNVYMYTLKTTTDGGLYRHFKHFSHTHTQTHTHTHDGRVRTYVLASSPSQSWYVDHKPPQ